MEEVVVVVVVPLASPPRTARRLARRGKVERSKVGGPLAQARRNLARGQNSEARGLWWWGRRSP